MKDSESEQFKSKERFKYYRKLVSNKIGYLETLKKNSGFDSKILFRCVKINKSSRVEQIVHKWHSLNLHYMHACITISVIVPV